MIKKEAMDKAESDYLSKINNIFSMVLLAHIPVALGLSMLFDTGAMFALAGSLAICSLPLLLNYFTKHHFVTAISHGIALMFYSGLLIHLSKGMIETHFHIFVSLASLILFANPFVILAATGTIAIHHLGFYFLLPESVFNYQASLGIVLIHAAYVVVQTIPCVWISKKFGDYIIRQGVVVHQIDDMYKSIKHTINDLQQSNSTLAQDSVLQTEVVSRTADEIQRIHQMVNETSENAFGSKMISEKTKETANHGLKAMNELTIAFNKIKDSNENLFNQMDFYNKQLTEIVENIRQIESKTQVINDIVFQTKLLSFNASVEAARAGENGKGFSVVAEEVGNLAAVSGNASKEINELINLSVQRVTSIAQSTKTKIEEISTISRNCIQDGEKKTIQTTTHFNELSRFLTDLDTKVVEISNASADQTKGIQKITIEVKELENVNGRASGAQKVANDVSNNLADLSNNMGELVEELLVSDKKKSA